MDYLKVDPMLRRRPRPKRAGWAAREAYVFLLQLSAEFDLYGRLSPSYQDLDFLADEWANGDASALGRCRDILAEGIPAALQAGLLVRDEDHLVITDWDKLYSRPKSGAERTAAWRAKATVTPAVTPSESEADVTEVTEVTDVTPVTEVTGVTNTVTCDATTQHTTKQKHIRGAPAPRAPVSVEPAALQALWNETADSTLPRWEHMPPARLRAAACRLRERPLEGPNGWRSVIERINESAFCRGKSDGRGWRATPDWLLKPGTAEKLLEGAYGGEQQAKPGTEPPALRTLRPGEDPYAEVPHAGADRHSH